MPKYLVFHEIPMDTRVQQLEKQINDMEQRLQAVEKKQATNCCWWWFNFQ